MASITSGEMADCDWPRSTFSGSLFSRNGPTRTQSMPVRRLGAGHAGGPLRKNERMHFKTKQQN
jgi:hypothetical protein